MITIPKAWDKNKADNRIIQICVGLKELRKEVILITKDTFERIKGDRVGIKSEDFCGQTIKYIKIHMCYIN